MRKGIEGGSNIFTVEGAVGAARDYEFRHYKDPGLKEPILEKAFRFQTTQLFNMILQQVLLQIWCITVQTQCYPFYLYPGLCKQVL